MTPDPYRIAHEKALEDLALIEARVEWLNTRKKHVENVIKALQPVCSPTEQAIHGSSVEESQQVSAEAEQSPSEVADNYSFLNVPAPLPQSDGDPFQRRVKASFRFRGLAAQR